MNRLTWTAVIVWGVLVTGFGLISAGARVDGVQPQDVVFLLAGGIVTILIGVVGILGLLGWVPGYRFEQKSYS